jgi:hypothetical protein
MVRDPATAAQSKGFIDVIANAFDQRDEDAVIFRDLVEGGDEIRESEDS